MSVRARGVVTAALVFAVGVSRAGGAGAPAPSPARAVDPAALLANVVHLSDSDVRLRSATGTTVLVDPMVGPARLAGRKAWISSPSLILITHAHLDHYNVMVLREHAKRRPGLVVAGPPDVASYARASGVAVTEVRPGQEYTLAGVSFRTVPAYYLDAAADHPREKGWVGYLLRLDGVRYYVTGDTQPLPEMAALKADVLFVGVLGCGSNVEQALEVVRICAPKVVVPVHSGGEDAVISEFLARLPRTVAGFSFKDGTLVAPRGSGRPGV